jgi:hypothetical protein
MKHAVKNLRLVSLPRGDSSALASEEQGKWTRTKNSSKHSAISFQQKRGEIVDKRSVLVVGVGRYS